ncbi:MAG: GvpL/GvpF family gas vesicle protein [Hyalangium sp.]|uniref:GvpL/GvpF family gas vesicle protein n=1 Tax=Hyalangium sp. TaxID=2028555 RepID=UPI00389A0F40
MSRPGGAGLMLYCIANASSAVPSDEPGVHGTRLLRVVQGELVAVVSPVADLARVTAPVQADLLAYERVIRSQHAVADVVPMRFGSVLTGEAAVRAHLGEQRATYLRVLARVTGCVEMGVRALISPPPPSVVREEAAPPPIRSGADYLKARQRRYSAESELREHGAALEQSLLSKVAPLCREHRLELSRSRPGEPVLCSVYFLVPRDQVPAFRAALASSPGADQPETSLSGPWPPFNFVD